MILISIAIKIDSKGPIIYKQKRVGKNGKIFNLYKFRTMYDNCDQKIHECHINDLKSKKTGLLCYGQKKELSYKIVNDDRITQFGKYLRRTSLDEIPQLFNVLMGEMSLVGPRPHPVYEAKLYNNWQKYRLEVIPGITGLGQVDGRYNREYEEVYRLDFKYVTNASILLDLKILLKTFYVVLLFRGAC
jgi:lipopolysaccharide/colanic/teichoic acid biosynthesis glycosyltransferase